MRANKKLTVFLFCSFYFSGILSNHYVSNLCNRKKLNNFFICVHLCSSVDETILLKVISFVRNLQNITVFYIKPAIGNNLCFCIQGEAGGLAFTGVFDFDKLCPQCIAVLFRD